MPRAKRVIKKTTGLPGERVDISGIVPPQSNPKTYARSTRSNSSKVSRSARLETAEVVEELPSDKLVVDAGEAGHQENNVSQRLLANQFDHSQPPLVLFSLS